MTELLWGDAALSGTGLAQSTAVLADLVAVHDPVRAGGSLAHAGPADAAQALGRELAALTGWAKRAIGRATAINAGLDIVSNTIGACWSLAFALNAHAGEAVGAHVTGVAMEAWPAWAAAAFFRFSARRIPLAVCTMRRHAIDKRAYGLSGAGNHITEARYARTFVAHARIHTWTWIPVRDERAYRFPRSAAIDGAWQSIIVKITGFRELDQISLTVAPPLRAIPCALRGELAKRLELEAANPVRACRFAATRIAWLRAVGRRSARAVLTARPTASAAPGPSRPL